MKKRIISLCLVVIMVLAMLPAMAGVAMAAEKKVTKKTIGIVFDNSGSMYSDGNAAWCRAIYAMEVFAAMMNAEDELYIFPMWRIDVNGTHYTAIDPLVISGPQDSNKIREIKSVYADGTPIHTITKAREKLADVTNKNGTEPYLIVLTDGDRFHTYPDYDALCKKETLTGVDIAGEKNLDGAEKNRALETELNAAAENMTTMFLKIGNEHELKQSADKELAKRQIYRSAGDSNQVLSVLTEMCNLIFGRNVLTGVSNEVSFNDVSMKKLIVFAQGTGVSDATIDGGTHDYSLYPKCSTNAKTKGIAGNKYEHAQKDDGLQGAISVYKDFAAGTYPVTITGNAEKVEIYYEPDVRVMLRVVDVEKKEVTPGEALYSGEYSVEYFMVDNKTGEPTESKWLGDTEYTINIGGEEKHDTKAGAVAFTLEEGEKLEGTVSVTFLDGYTDSISMEELGWTGDKNTVVDRPIGTLELAVSGGSSEYPLSQLEELAVYDVTMTYDGEPVTENITLDRVELTGGNAIVGEPEKTADGYQVRIRYNGTAVDTQCGEYKLTLQGSYVNEDGNTATSQPKELPFTVTDDSTTMEAKFQLAQDYYVMSKIEEGQPIYFCIRKDGERLTPGEFEQVDVTVDLGELDGDIQADPAESRYVITLKKTEGLESGSYKISATAVGRDELGREITMQDEASLSIRPYPEWVVWLFWILVALAVVAAIWTYMNSKVLPRQIDVDECSFTVKGRKVNGDAECEFSGKGKKRGTLKIMSPTPDGDASARCGFVLDLVAVSPRRKRSCNRLAKVVSVMPAMNAGSTTLITIGGEDVRRDKATGKWLVDPELPDEPLDIILSSEDLTYVTAKVQDYERNTTKTVAMSVPVVFY